MRVMLFSDTYPPQVNGVATSVHSLARALSDQGHAVMVCTVGGGRRRAAGDDPFVVVRTRAVPLPLYADFTIAPPIVRVFGRLAQHFRPDVIHCHTPFGVGWQGARAAIAGGIPLIGTHHTLFGEYVEAYSRLGRQVNQRLAALIRRYVANFYNQCDVVSCASRYLANDLHAGGMYRPVAIVPNALNTERFRPLAAEEQARKMGKRIIYFGRLAAEKNLPRMMRLTEPVLRRHPDVTLEIVGEGPVLGSLTSLAYELGLERQVRFLGWMRGETLVRQVASSDICVSASLTENQPMALLESLACGVPVVALAAAGVPEIIEDGMNGFLVAPDDATETFAQRLEELIGDAELRAAMSVRAYASAQAYAQAACLRMTLDSYEEAQRTAAERRVLGRRRGLRARRLDPRHLARRIPGRIARLRR